jgi:hypothetical protein
MAGFIKMMRESEENRDLWAFLDRRPAALILLTLMARRARRQDGLDPKSGILLAAGESLLGDFKTIGLTERTYRTAKSDLQKVGLATFKATTKGTIGKIVNTAIYDINEERSDGQNDRQATDKTTGKRRTGDGRATTNKEVKEVEECKEHSLSKKRDRERTIFGQLDDLEKAYIKECLEKKQPRNPQAYALAVAEDLLKNRDLKNNSGNERRIGHENNKELCPEDIKRLSFLQRVREEAEGCS